MAKYGINKVILVGNLGKDPEVRQLDGGVSVARFSLATTESVRTRDGRNEDRTEWHNIVVWRGLADVAGKYLKKGSTVYLEGKISNRSWETPEGVKKYITEIDADKMVMLDSRPSQQDRPDINQYNQAGFADFPSPQSGPKEEANDDLPF